MKKTNLSKICIPPDASIRQALNMMALVKTKKFDIPAGIILVCDSKGKLLGLATDGDIRRGLSKGISLDDLITKIMNPNPFLIEGPLSNNEVLALIANKIKKEQWHKDRLNKIVIVDKNKQVLDVVSFYDLWQSSDVRFKQIGVVGLGYVGLTLAVTLADIGFKVHGFDSDAKVINLLNSGKPHFFEQGLEQIFKDNFKSNLNIVGDFKEENNCDVYFIAVGTPLDKKTKKPDLKHIKSAAENVGSVLKFSDAVVLRSTVPISTTRKVVIPILEKKSGLKAGGDFFVAFAPERTVEGRALEELKKLPQVIGGINWASVDLVASIFNHLTHSVVLVDSLEEAEMVKLVNNVYRDVTFAFANELSLICNKIGIDTRRVIEAANRGYDRGQVPLPSPGVGGVCLEKDPFLFIGSAKNVGYFPKLAQNARDISGLMVDFVATEISSFLKSKKINSPKILIMGIAFKGRPATSDIRGSTSIGLIARLKKFGFNNIFVYDPVVKSDSIAHLGVKYTDNLKQAFSGADAIVVMNNNPAFEDLNIRSLLSLAHENVLLFDAWGLYKAEEINKVQGVKYKKL